MKKANELIKFLAHPIFPASKLLNRPAPGTILRGAFGYEDWMDRATAPLAFQDTTILKPYKPCMTLPK